MIYLEDYQFEYELFLSEQELFESVISLGADYVNESVSIISINEGVKEAVTNYIHKVTTALQNAWDKFNQTVSKVTDKNYLTSKLREKIDSYESNFFINNYPNFNAITIDNIKVVPLNYEEMKPYLDSQTNFANKYYPSIMTDSNKTIGENIQDMGIKSREDNKRCTKEMLLEMFDYVTKEFPNKIKNMENDIKVVNNTNNQITALTNQLSTDNTVGESVNTYKYYLVEAEEDTKVEYKDDPNAKKPSNLAKEISVYMGVTMSIISAKMKIHRDMFSFYLRTLKHAIKPEKEKSENDTDQVEVSSNVKTQVDL